MMLGLITLRNKKDDLEVNLQGKKSGSGLHKASGKRKDF